MKNECKILKFNFLLLIIVAVLLIIAILVGVRILFHDSKGYEWVTVAGTWISALGTLGTLWVAYKAFKAAPHWLSQKHYDVAYSVIEKAIYQDLIKVRSASLILKNHLVTSARMYRNHLNKGFQLQDSHDEFMNKTDTLVSDLSIISYSVINALKSIDRTNYSISNYTTNIINELQSQTKKYNDLSIELYIASSSILSLAHADESVKDIESKELHDMMMNAISFHETLSNFIKEIYDNNYPVDKFIFLK
ncbi:hypothetical protein OGV37_00250 [Citrobacter sp. Cb010]|uniref:hypothetical protein n=1 Tax=Citrobacter TaxID=544 RepID=UPI002576FD3F|nr:MULTISPECIES: hypothetical protein [unclassified Citrobacter]MDM3373327.1 hypothetical protein [Citrobacter sp. Cb010]MDM3460498.1 hypothetical protein [Citrobacter sp. Cb036]